MAINKELVFAQTYDPANTQGFWAFKLVFNPISGAYDGYVEDKSDPSQPALAANITATGTPIAGSGGSGLTIGQTVSGGTINEVLFVDALGKLRDSANFLFDSVLKKFTAGDNTAALLVVDPSTSEINLLTGAGQTVGVQIDATDVTIAAPAGVVSIGDPVGGAPVITIDGTNDIISFISTNSLFFPDNVRQVFNPGTNVAGLNVGAVAADPNTPLNADLWYNSTTNLLKARINGATVTLGATTAPGGSNTQLQFNQAGAFGGVSGVTSDGTNITAGSGNLRATSPQITTGINDANGNAMILFTAVGSAVNQITISNNSTTSSPVISATGTATNLNIVLTPKGTGGVIFPDGSTAIPGIGFTGNTITGFTHSSQTIYVLNNGNPSYALTGNSSGFLLASNRPIGWDNGTSVAAGAIDAGLGRNAAGVVEVNNGTLGTFRDLKARQYFADQTITPGGTTGNQTINKSAGTVNIAAGNSTVTVTSSNCTTSSTVYCTIRTNDATARIANVVPGTGSFVINLTAAATAEISIGFLVVN